MYYYITLTTKCNLLCKYCYGHCAEDYLNKDEEKEYDLDLPSEITYKIEDLKKLIEKDKDNRITFYGGEPLLRIDTIKKIIDEVPAKEFMLQTNGILLDKLPINYLNRIKTILVSIDGDEKTTDTMRGIGTYNKIMNNLIELRKKGYKGEIIARMVAFDGSDIYKNVTHLINNNKFKFTSIHWQIDAMFWRCDYEKRNFKKWTEKYNNDIKKLINFWIEELKKGRVIKVYPFIGIIHDLYYGIKAKMRCGAGHKLFGIQPDGTITACPITSGYRKLYCGHIKKGITKKILPKEPCTSCKIYHICGGRCLYANYTKLWGEKGYKEVCETVFSLIDNLQQVLPTIKDLIKKGIIKEKDLDFDKYNGCEIIP